MDQFDCIVDFGVFSINAFQVLGITAGLCLVTKEEEVFSRASMFSAIIVLLCSWSPIASASDIEAPPKCFGEVGDQLQSTPSLMAAMPLHVGSGEMLGWFDGIDCASELDLDGDGDRDVVAKIHYRLRYEGGARAESVLHVFVFFSDARGLLMEAAREGANFFAEGGGGPPEVIPIPVGDRIELLWVEVEQYSGYRTGVVTSLEEGQMMLTGKVDAPMFGDEDTIECRNESPPSCVAGHYAEQRAEKVVVVGDGCRLRNRKGRCRSRRVVNELVLSP